MAEFIQLRMEEMRPELEQYAKFELFGLDEIRDITIKRKDLEYKLHKRVKGKEDYLQYIQYEVDLLRLLRLKLKNFKTSGKTTKIKKELCRFIVNRITKLLDFAVNKFPQDARMWFTYVKFCKAEARYSEVSRNLERMLKFHGSKEEMWQLAAHWEYLECNNIKGARAFLLSGMRHHPKSELIYLEALWLELKGASDLRLEEIRRATLNKTAPNLDGDEIMKGELGFVMYQCAIEKLDSCKYLCAALKIALDFEFATELQKIIKRQLMKQFSDDFLTWKTLAQLELESYTLEGRFNIRLYYTRQKNPELQPSKRQIKYAFEILETAAHNINDEDSWSQFINMWLDLIEKSEENGVGKRYPNLLNRQLKEALESAHIQAKLPAEFYKHYVDMLDDDEAKIDEVLSMATDRNPKCAELWMARLKLSFIKDDKAKSKKIFEEGIKNLKESEHELDLWILMKEQFANEKDFLDKLFRKASATNSTSAEKIKIMHLNFVAAHQGLLTCRSLYAKLSVSPPFSLELHRKMIELETGQPKVDVRSTRRCFEIACNQFGTKNADHWMEYIDFEMKHGSKHLITQLYTRASKELEPAESEKFAVKYQTLQLSM
ncbi:U3 small nucleolar RNA-associated protein 6 homolog [Cloeon dipterum]|uniref:U3 small nucleolar RNA-associated protein 6 homolog n=1 Tax=Cloeon dipterum TaxID=197152 RepID=UPI0032200FCC